MEQHRNYNQGIVIPSAFIYLLSILELMHPYLGMRLAAFFFAKPYRYKLRVREIPVMSQAEKSSIYIKKLNKYVSCYNWNGKGPKIMLMNGWSGRDTNFYLIIEALIRLDFDIYAFDAPAHGKSSGLTTNLPEFIVTLDSLLRHLGPFEVILGHSGGAFASLYVCVNHSEIRKLILISPFDKVIDLFKKYFELIGLGEKARKLMLDYFHRKTNKKISAFSSSISAQSINANCMIIHDKNDREVELHNSINIRNNLKNGKLIITSGLGHRRILRDYSVIDQIVSFLKPH